ncbi:response regulator transcription factor [Paenibacillus sp. EC2-1]|uniref:response regulator transcription factor n=1 Tax=Paenibacillus sp. EC2-1 TaxID=3388665 RepID=UPI003BEF0AAC
MMKILIIEDEDVIRNELASFLSGYGYEIAVITDFNDILERIEQVSPELILLDINLPYYDGYYLCRNIRKSSHVPIIVVTSRNNEMDELMSMNLGADDFVTKPYNTQILLARIESVLKRTYINQITEELNYADLKLDLAKGSIHYHDGEQPLTKNELKIMHFLMKNKGRVISREEMMEHLWSSELFVDDNTLSVNMTRLRKKIELMGMTNPIETRRGLGYIMP